MKSLKILVTAGSTCVMIDRVRTISNNFRGRTGHLIAEHLAQRLGHQVTLLTSNAKPGNDTPLTCLPYRTYDELAEIMEHEIGRQGYDVVIHSAAVSDYRVSRVCTLGESGELAPVDTGKKISSVIDRLYLELVPTPKLIDCIRTQWGFDGYLVKFKLEVGRSDDELVQIAEASRRASQADLMVANCLEWAQEYAYIMDETSSPLRVKRQNLPEEIGRRITCASRLA